MDVSHQESNRLDPPIVDMPSAPSPAEPMDGVLTDRIDTVPERHPAVLEINKIPGLPVGFFNAAAMSVGEGLDRRTLLLGRNVQKRGDPGQPDIGSLALAVINNGQVQSFAEVWQPEEGGHGDLLEDARATELPDGRIVIGYTRLAPNQGRYEPYPAVSITTTEALLRGEFPDTHHITGLGKGDETVPIGSRPGKLHLLPGKNATPLGPERFMFRREADDHRLVTFSIDEEGNAQNLQNLHFPPDSVPDWAERRLGSTMPPVWLDDNEAIFLMHGIRMVGDRYKYSIGSARLFVNDEGGYSVDNISSEPLLTPESFQGMFPGEQVQLRPEERDALYLCGGVTTLFDSQTKRPQIISIMPSLGDMRTLEAVISVAEIEKNWQRTGQPAAVRSTAA